MVICCCDVGGLHLRVCSAIGNNEVFEAMKCGDLLDMPEECPGNVYDVMKAYWERDTAMHP